MKDFANSYAQAKWRFAANTHARLKRALVQFAHMEGHKILTRWREDIRKLEEEYPSLKEEK